jgi:iron complex transport system ATP-binding protein
MIIESAKQRVLFSTQKVSIGYLERGALHYLQKDLDIRLHEGDLICLIGPNGCGKSTLIRTLAGLQKPLEGNILVGEKPISQLSISELTRFLGTVLTDKSVVDQITVEEIVALGRYHTTNWLGSEDEKDKLMIEKAISAVRLNGMEKRTYDTLSDGERQRAFIAKALASDASVMLLDEPTAHLDIVNRVEILSLLRNLTHKTGHTILVSTHELDLAMQLADEIWVMSPGRSLITGTPEEIVHSGILDEVFGNEVVHFNQGSGSFSLRRNHEYPVKVEGSGKRTHITLDALSRLGFRTDHPGMPIATVIISDHQWELSVENINYSTPDLAELCRMLRGLVRNNILK